MLEAAEKASYEVYAEMSAKSAALQAHLPEWKKFRDEQFLWFRVAERTYDNYSFNSKLGVEAPAAAKGGDAAKKAPLRRGVFISSGVLKSGGGAFFLGRLRFRHRSGGMHRSALVRMGSHVVLVWRLLVTKLRKRDQDRRP